MGADQSKTEQPGAGEVADASDFTSASDTKRARLNRRGTEIERERGGGDEGEEGNDEAAEGFGSQSGKASAADARKQRRKKRGPRRTREAEAGGEERAESDLEDTAKADGLNFNRDFEIAGSAAGSAAVAGASSAASPSALSPGAPPRRREPREPEYDEDGNLIEDDEDEENLDLPKSPLGRNVSTDGIGNDLEEVDAEALKKEFAFKTVGSAAEAERLDFEYDLSELSARLGPGLKILAAGYDEPVMYDTHMRPTSSYSAYNLHPQQAMDAYNQLYGDAAEQFAEDEEANQQFGPNGSRRPSAMQPYAFLLDESQNYGYEYQPASVPFTPEELQLQKAAAARRRRKIKVELAWLKQRKEEKAAERELQRKRAEYSEKSQTSKSGVSTVASSSRKSWGGGMEGQKPVGFGGKRVLGGAGAGGGPPMGMRSSLGNIPVGIRSSLIMGQGTTKTRRTSNMGSAMASPRG